MIKPVYVWVLAILLVAIGCCINGAVVYYLWNWIVPSLFHAAKITFIQSVGICFLCFCLFGRVTINKK